MVSGARNHADRDTWGHARAERGDVRGGTPDDAHLRHSELHRAIEAIPIEGESTVHVDDQLLRDVFADPTAVANIYSNDPERFRGLIESDTNAEDVIALQHRRDVAATMREWLDDATAFEQASSEAGGPEKAWQAPGGQSEGPRNRSGWPAPHIVGRRSIGADSRRPKHQGGWQEGRRPAPHVGASFAHSCSPRSSTTRRICLATSTAPDVGAHPRSFPARSCRFSRRRISPAGNSATTFRISRLKAKFSPQGRSYFSLGLS